MRTRFVLATWFLVLLSVSFAFGQTTVDFGPTRDDVLKFMDVMQVRHTMSVMIEQMKLQVKRDMRRGMEAKTPHLTPKQEATIDHTIDTMFTNFPTDELIDVMVPVYQRHISKEDLNALIAFYSSPTGQRILSEMPAMMTEGMQAASDVATRRIAGIRTQVDSEVEQMRKKNETNSTPASRHENAR